jgi:hypothetical protein
MARKGTSPRKAEPVPGDEKQLVGRRVLAPLEGWLRYLHNLPTHGNRDLFADHVLVAHLLAFLSPALKSLRRLETLFDHPVARRRFGLPRVPKSTLSDAQAVFDPALLDPLIADLRRRVPQVPHDPQLDRLLKKLTAVDGSFFRLAPRVWWALCTKPNGTPRQPRQQNQHGNVRVDVHFNVLDGVPEQVVLTNGRTPEYETLRTHLEAEHFYVLDRAYHAYDVLGAIVAAKSDFLVRLRGDMQFAVLEELPRSAAECLAGVQQVQIVQAQSVRGREGLGDCVLKLVTVQTAEGSPLRLLTNRLDLEAELLAVVYRHRWQIELFFRWLKCLVRFDHFFSEQPNGVALQMGAAVIGTLLLALAIEERPSSYDWAMMTHVMSGLVPLDEQTLKILAKRRAERARSAAWQKAYRARKKAGR